MGWNFKEDTYKGMDNFVLQMEYTYTDDSYVYSSILARSEVKKNILLTFTSVGEAPYNRVTEFSTANITDTNIDCSLKTQGCQLCNNNTITAIVYASIA